MSNALLVAWRSGTPERGWQPVGRLEYEGGVYRFVYTHGARLMADFQPFPRWRIWRRFTSQGSFSRCSLIGSFPRAGPEYEAYLKWGGFDPNEPPEPLSILGVTEGRRQTDSIEMFPCPEKDSSNCYVNKFFLHGLRWMAAPALERISQLQGGEELYLLPDVFNPNVPQAVALRTAKGDRFMIGYVPRYLARDVWKLLRECCLDYIKVFVARVNKDAPLQQRLLCRMHACWPEGIRPCDDEAFRPISALASGMCEEAVSDEDPYP
jgi:hypothetical protein